MFDNRFILVAVITMIVIVCFIGLIFWIGYKWAYRHADERNRKLTARDPLTGLFNRQSFLNELEMRIHQHRSSGSFCVAVMNVNRFRWINDALGNEFGDLVIRIVAEHIRSVAGETAVIARLNGDEFAVILDLDMNRSLHVTSLMLKRFEETPIILNSKSIHILASAGIASFPEHGNKASEVLGHADTALSRARQSYNSVVVFENYMNQELHDSFRLATDLRFAINNGELYLLYQPRVCLVTGRIVAVEALVRWNHPQLGLISPGRFIPIAEQTGCMIPIGLWVLETSCKQAVNWLLDGMDEFRLSVNISVQQLLREDFVQSLDDILQRTGLQPDRLELELTESIFIENPDAIIDTLATIKRRGIQIAIDDFGKGYSSLNYLKSYPADILKIDKGFIAETRSGTGQIITISVIQLARKLGLTVVAEGVEHPEQLEFLIRKGCDEVQGFLLSEPVQAERCKHFMQYFRLDNLLNQLHATKDSL